YGHADNTGFSQRGVKASFGTEPCGQPVGDAENTTEGAHILTKDHYRVIGNQGISQGGIQRLAEGHRLVFICSLGCGTRGGSADVRVQARSRGSHLRPPHGLVRRRAWLAARSAAGSWWSR